MKSPKICVVGASNFDLISYTDSLPKQGETILGHNFKMGCGGKGANQAVAASKLGAHVTLITKLGTDIFGQKMLQNYKDLNIDISHVYTTDEASSGVAPITVDKEGHNSIIVVSGANDCMTLEEIDKATAAIQTADILICQHEIPFSLTEHAIQIAKLSSTKVIFNPSPAHPHLYSDEFLNEIDILCLNETEAELITKKEIKSLEDAKKTAQILCAKGIKTIILTLGGEGALLAQICENEVTHFTTNVIQTLDTSGAGDCFLGSFSYFYGLGLSIEEAIKRAQYVAGYSVQKYGTQTSYPFSTELPVMLFD